MPEGMDGVQLAEIMKKEFPAIPVLLTSGYSDVAADAVIRGFHVIRKPYRLEDLGIWLRKLLAIPSV
jgi:DNA-binding NtrC family response regulator